MEIIIGRDTETSKLKLIADGQSSLHGEAGSVPASVNDRHCSIAFSAKGISLKNLDINSYTYVNGQAVEQKEICMGDRIELGTDHYLLSWDAVSQVGPADIRHLKQIWEEYDTHRMDQQIADRRFNSLRSATGIITMAAIALSITTGRQSVWFIVLYVVAILISLAFTVKAWKDASAIPQKAQQLNRQFQHDYVCPSCGHFLGSQPYELLAQNDHCPYCKKHFIH